MDAAVLALTDTPIHRLVQGLVRSGELLQPLVVELNAGGLNRLVHIDFLDASVDLAGGATERALVTLRARARLVTDTPLPAGIDPDSGMAIQLDIPVVADDTSIGVDLAALAIDDVAVTLDNPAFAAFGDVVRAEVHRAVTDGALGGISFELTIGASLTGDLTRVGFIVEDPQNTDRDELVLVHRAPTSPAPTAADAQRQTDQPSSIALFLSRELVEAEMVRQVDERLMRYTVRNSEEAKAHGIRIEQIGSLWAVVGDPRGARDHVRVRIRAPESGWADELDTDKNGVFGTFIPVSQWSPGHQLVFEGLFQRDGSKRIKQIELALADGAVHVRALIERDVACYNNVQITLEGDLDYAIDPADGKLWLTPRNVDLDAPWYVDALNWVVKLGTSVIGGIGMLDLEKKEERKAGEDLEEDGQSFAAFIPAVRRRNVRLFWHGIGITTDGVKLQGNLETGWLRDRPASEVDRFKALVVPSREPFQLATEHLDWDEDLDGDRVRQRFSYASASRTLRLEGPDRMGYFEDAGSYVNLSQAQYAWTGTGMDFHALDQDSIEAEFATGSASTASGGSGLSMLVADPVKVARGEAPPPPVILVRSVWGRLGKVQFRARRDGDYAVRWIVYDRPLVEARILAGSPDVSADGLRYRWSLRVQTQGMSDALPPAVLWSSDRGVLTPDPNDSASAVLTLDLDGQPMLGAVRVQAIVTDMAWRTADATTHLAFHHPDYKPPKDPQDRLDDLFDRFLKPRKGGVPFPPEPDGPIRIKLPPSVEAGLRIRDAIV